MFVPFLSQRLQICYDVDRDRRRTLAKRRLFSHVYFTVYCAARYWYVPAELSDSVSAAMLSRGNDVSRKIILVLTPQLYKYAQHHYSTVHGGTTCACCVMAFALPYRYRYRYRYQYVYMYWVSGGMAKRGHRRKVSRTQHGQ